MAIRDDFFTALNKGAKWDVGVSINRTNPLPLDVNSVFESKDALDTYASGAFSYPGQVVAVVEATATTIYYIDQNKAVHEVGKIPVGDGKSIAVAEDGTISLLGLANAEAGAQPEKQADGSIKWVKHDTSGLVKDVADVKSNLANNYYDKTAVDGLVAGAFHFKGDAKELNAEGNLIGADDKVISGKAGDVYQVGDKEYAYNGKVWVELGFTLDLSAYATTESVKAAVKTAKEEAVATAGTNADTKIATKVGEIGEKTVKDYVDEIVSGLSTDADAKIAAKVGDIGSATVKAYVDGKETTLNSSIKSVSDKVSAIVGDDKNGDGIPKSAREVAEEVAAEKVGAIPNAAQETAGLIKGTANKVNVSNGQITSITTDALTQGTDTLIIDGGSSAN